MSEILDQQEVEALLAAVKEGETPASGPATAGEPESPFSIAAEAVPYDFTRPERVSKDQIRALASIHEVFARNFGATLSGFLRTIIDVHVLGVEQLTYNEFIHSLPNPTCFMVIQAPPLEGQMCLELSPLIVYPIIDRLLGGSNQTQFIPQRPLTSIESRLTSRIAEKALEHLSEVWRNLVDARFEIVETESNPHLVHIVAPTEVVVFITFELRFGQCVGTMSLCIPFNTIESVLSRLTTQSWFFKPRATAGTHQQRILRNLSHSSVELTTYLAESRIRLSELRSLRPGDLITFDKRAGKDLIIRVAGLNKFAGQPCQLRGHRAIRLTRKAPIDEPL